MCTVSYLPVKEASYIITSTRDEKTSRKSALPPEQYEISGQPVYFPRDQEANGTWIASTASGLSLCLLNGGTEIHVSSPPYRRSRGLVLLDFFACNDTVSYLKTYDFSGIEPFTLIVVDYNNKDLSELRWNGNIMTQISKDYYRPHIWSSVTLYTDDIIKKREAWFHDWLLNRTDYHMNEIIGFHKTGGTGDSRYDILMNRDDEVRTVSITSFQSSPNTHVLRYEDILMNKTSEIAISNK